jgi:hypothetical protein
MMGGFVMAMPAGQTVCDNPEPGETEFALAVSPCPQIEPSKDIGEKTEFASRRSGLDRRRHHPRSQSQRKRETVPEDHDLTETLTIGWAIASAIAVALAVYVSRG